MSSLVFSDAYYSFLLYFENFANEVLIKKEAIHGFLSWVDSMHHKWYMGSVNHIAPVLKQVNVV